jgi:hypothetical protein
MLTALFSSLALVALQAEPDRIAVERSLAAGVIASRAQERVRELVALGPRMGGTRSGDQAAAALAKAFGELGLDVRVVDDPPRAAYQPLKWWLRARRGDSDPVVLERAWPWQFSPNANGSAELALESREGAAWITDKVARGESAAAVVLSDGSCNSDGSWPIARWLRDGAKQPCFGISKPEGAMLRGWLAEGARVRIEFELDGEARTAPPKTVIARLPGAAGGEPWKRDYFLFCAHGDSDSAGPGADDNASGVATVLEIATAWKRAIDAKLAPPPAHEVRFAIWGSEIYSTNAYLKDRVPAEGNVLGVINYDQSGFGSGADQVNVEPDDLEGNVALVRTLLAVMKEHAPTVAEKPGEFPARWATNKSLGGTDSYVFSRSELFKQSKLPSVTVFASAWGAPDEHPRTKGMPGESWQDREVVSVDYDLYYHSAGDTPANTTDKESWNMAWCARVGMLGAKRYLEGLK